MSAGGIKEKKKSLFLRGCPKGRLLLFVAALWKAACGFEGEKMESKLDISRRRDYNEMESKLSVRNEGCYEKPIRGAAEGARY